MKKYLSEFIGTYALIFFGTGAVVVNDLQGGLIGHLGISITFGLIVIAMVYTFGETSGAHINPAVSLAFWVSGDLARKDLLPYWGAQFLGASAASGTLWLLFPGHAHYGATVPAGSVGQSWLLELILTYFLMLVIIFVVRGPKENLALAGGVIGLTVLLEALFAGPISGASMNPARSLGPALIAKLWQDQWIYLTAPPMGAILAILTYKGMYGEEGKEAPKKVKKQ